MAQALTMEPRRQANRHFAVAAYGLPYHPAGNFDYDAHDRWVQAGHCPVVSNTKAWCSLKAGHPGQHGSPFIRANTTGESFIWWDS